MGDQNNVFNYFSAQGQENNHMFRWSIFNPKVAGKWSIEIESVFNFPTQMRGIKNYHIIHNGISNLEIA